MIGELIVFAVVVALVASYIFVVNRTLRSDEHWNEHGAELPPVQRNYARATAREQMSSVTLSAA